MLHFFGFSPAFSVLFFLFVKGYKVIKARVHTSRSYFRQKKRLLSYMRKCLIFRPGFSSVTYLHSDVTPPASTPIKTTK